MLFSLALQMHGMPKAQEMRASCAGGASRYLYVLYIYIHICTVIGFSSCCSTTQYVFENWLCMQSHICGSLRLFAHFLCERGKLGANSTLVPSWGREGHYVFIMTLGHGILVEMAGRQGSALMIYIVISSKNCTPMPI
jgi:hypothetical protein